MSAEITPAVSMLKAFRVESSPDQLEYPNLDAVAEDARGREPALFDEFWEAEPGSLEEEKIARRLAMGYFVLTGHVLQNTDPRHKTLVSERFTQSSVELYGEPDKNEALQLVDAQAASFRGLIGNPQVDHTRLHRHLEWLYEASGSHADVREAETERNTEAITEGIKQILEQRYGSIFRLIDDVVRDAGYNENNISIEEVRSLFQVGIHMLTAQDSTWAGWRVEIADQLGMSTDAKRKVIKIGNEGTYPPQRLKALFSHEVLVHGLRSVNGSKTGDAALQQGLPGNLDAEEGIATLFEQVIDGVVPDKVIDRYIDTAFALGYTDLPALTRQQLHGLHTDRQVLRAQAAKGLVDEQAISRKAWGHVDRIYRGSLGNELIGVNTKDIAYYQGYKKIMDYMHAQIEQGIAIETVYAYIMQGCFDPTDYRHQEYVGNQVSCRDE